MRPQHQQIMDKISEVATDVIYKYIKHAVSYDCTTKRIPKIKNIISKLSKND